MSDLALKAAGLACAAGSVWFAVHMFNHQEAGPRVNAMEDFAIFAQPNRTRAVEAAVRAAAHDTRNAQGGGGDLDRHDAGRRRRRPMRREKPRAGAPGRADP